MSQVRHGPTRRAPDRRTCPPSPTSLQPIVVHPQGEAKALKWVHLLLFRRSGPNMQSPTAGFRFKPSVALGHFRRAEKQTSASELPFLYGGTDGSNPLPSSGQSVSLPHPLSRVENPGFPRGCARLAWRPDRRDARDVSISRQPATKSLSGHMPVPQRRLWGRRRYHPVPRKSGLRR